MYNSMFKYSKGSSVLFSYGHEKDIPCEWTDFNQRDYIVRKRSFTVFNSYNSRKMIGEVRWYSRAYVEGRNIVYKKHKFTIPRIVRTRLAGMLRVP